MNGACTIVNADMQGVSSLCMEHGHILALDATPQPGDRVVDLRGDRLLPGLINAHDHLHLNLYPRLRFRERHENAAQWIRDIDTRRHTDPDLVRCARVARSAQLWHGALKNLLSGVTTVSHHDPCYDALTSADFPLRVPRQYGWSHSLYVDGEERVQQSCARTPPEWPWIIHAGEGIDAEAAREFERLEALGCVRANTVIVHGVGFDAAQLRRLHAAGAGLVWCPSSNLQLFGRTTDVGGLAKGRALALGSDSRLSGSRDLLAELQVAARCTRFDEAQLTRMVTCDAARMLRLADRGRLAEGQLADLLVLPRGLPLGRATRADVRAVLIGGRMRYGDAEYAAAFGDQAQLVACTVDGVPKLLDRELAQRLALAGITEPGLRFEPDAGWRAA